MRFGTVGRAVTSVGVVAAWLLLGSLAPGAPRVPHVGVLSPLPGRALLDPLRQGLMELGYVEGRTIAFELRSADGRADRLLQLAAELVRLKVDVIVTASPPGVRAAKQATTTIPIVIGVDDAVEQGFVASLARPGGNVTGTSWLNTELSAKRLQLLKEAFPAVSRVALLREAVGGASSVRATMAAARSLGVHLQVFELRDPDELESAFSAMAKDRAQALSVLQGPMIDSHHQRIVQLATRARLPAIFPDDVFVDAGGFMSYGPSLPDMYRRAAVYVDRILKGARAGDLPVEQPTRFRLAINLRSARALGLTVPESLLIRADHVITP